MSILCDPMDYSLPEGKEPVSSTGASVCACEDSSVVPNSLRPCQAPLSMGFSRQEYWSGMPFPTLGALPYPGIEPESPALEADSLPLAPPGKH